MCSDNTHPSTHEFSGRSNNLGGHDKITNSIKTTLTSLRKPEIHLKTAKIKKEPWSNKLKYYISSSGPAAACNNKALMRPLYHFTARPTCPRARVDMNLPHLSDSMSSHRTDTFNLHFIQMHQQTPVKHTQTHRRNSSSTTWAWKHRLRVNCEHMHGSCFPSLVRGSLLRRKTHAYNIQQMQTISLRG